MLRDLRVKIQLMVLKGLYLGQSRKVDEHDERLYCLAGMFARPERESIDGTNGLLAGAEPQRLYVW